MAAASQIDGREKNSSTTISGPERERERVFEMEREREKVEREDEDEWSK